MNKLVIYFFQARKTMNEKNITSQAGWNQQHENLSQSFSCMSNNYTNFSHCQQFQNPSHFVGENWKNTQFIAPSFLPTPHETINSNNSTVIHLQNSALQRPPNQQNPAFNSQQDVQALKNTKIGTDFTQSKISNLNYPTGPPSLCSSVLNHPTPYMPPQQPNLSRQSFNQVIPNNVSVQPQGFYQHQNNTQPQNSIQHIKQNVRPLNAPYFNLCNQPPPLLHQPRVAPPSSYTYDFLRQPPHLIPLNHAITSPPIEQSLTNINIPPRPPFPLLPQSLTSNLSKENEISSNLKKPSLVEDDDLTKFLKKFSIRRKENIKNNMSIVDFRNKLKQYLSLIEKLMACKKNLEKMLHSSETDWSSEIKEALKYQNELIQESNFIMTPAILNNMKRKLQFIKKKRELKKKVKQDALIDRQEKLKKREKLHLEIDKWLDSIKEKNLKLKREAEMKNEADIILSEVRRKIQEAKRALEKIKVFGKLRNTRQANAEKKGLFLPEHNETFQNKISELKEIILGQLSHYESEEKALKVMLEAEQEGQLEEEALWKVKRLKTLQQRRQHNIIKCLFGNSEEPQEDDAIFLFHQYQTSGSRCIDTLVQIRHQWDVHINEEGEAVSLPWVAPAPPNGSGWEVVQDK